MKTYGYGKQSIDPTDIEAVVKTFSTGWLTQGPLVADFESALASRFGAQKGVAVSSGTASLHLLGIALGWKEGDVVITTPNSFLASANCILYSGATPEFADIDPKTYNICPLKLEEKIKMVQRRGARVVAVIAVDFAGHPCEWDDLVALGKKYDFDLIADSCHALGAKYKGIDVCSSNFSRAVNLSFHPVKSLTTGEGGAVLTNDIELAERLKMLRSHGMTKNPDQMEKVDGPWYYEMIDLGFNYRITDIQCALGLSQLKRLEQFNKRRREIARHYDSHLDQDLIQLPEVKPYVEHAYHLYPIQLRLESLTVSREKIFNALKENGLNLQVHYYPIPLQPYYKKNFGFKEGDFPEAERFYQRELSIPIYPDLDDEDLQHISATMNSVVRSFRK